MKKKLASKVLAGVLASTMVLSMAACGDDSKDPSGSSSGTPSGSSTPSSQNTSAPETQATPTPKPAPLKITVALPSGGNIQPEGNEWYDKLVKEINEYTNMDVTYSWEESATYYDQLQQKVQASNIADVIVGPNKIDDPNTSFILKACDEGLFWDLAPYIDQFDNLATIPEATLASCSYNGKVYAIPRSRTLARNGFGYRKDWLDKKNMDPPTTWAEFKEMLRVFTEEDPDGDGLNNTQGLVVDGWQDVWKIIFAWFGVPDTWGLDKDGNLIYYTQTEEYKEALKEIRDLYSKGYINDGSVEGIPDFMDLNPGAVRKEYMGTGKAGVMIQCLDEIRKAEISHLVKDGVSTEEDPAIELAGYLDCGHGTHVLGNDGGYKGTIMISKVGNVKTEAQLLQVLGYLNDLNDGSMLNLIEYGWEGLTYKLDENGNVVDFTADELTASGVGSKLAYSDGFNQILAYYTADANARPVERAAATTVIQKQENQLYEDNIQYVVINHGAGLISSVASDKGADLGKIISDAQLAYIKGEITEDGLNEALTRWKTAGGDDMTKEMNDLYKESHK